MDLARTDRRTRQFVTNVGLITSTGPQGPNIMAAAWTHQVSHAPGLIAVCVAHNGATAHNARETRQFGVNLASQEQAAVCSIASAHSGRDVDKLSALMELGWEFYPGRRIRSLMLKDAALNAECTLARTVELGDHLMLVGEVVEFTGEPGIRPLVYHDESYFELGRRVSKPGEAELKKIREAVANHRKAGRRT